MRLEFEWDKNKNADNKKNHGVSFEGVKEVFYDPRATLKFDREHSIFEERWIAIGLSGLTVYVVCFTERNGSVRIISAREATKIEEEEYFYGYSEL